MHNIKNLIYLNIVNLLSLIFYIFISNFFPNKKIDIVEINNFIVLLKILNYLNYNKN